MCEKRKSGFAKVEEKMEKKRVEKSLKASFARKGREKKNVVHRQTATPAFSADPDYARVFPDSGWGRGGSGARNFRLTSG